MATNLLNITFSIFRPDLNAIELWNARVKDTYRKKLLVALMQDKNVRISPLVTAAIESVSNDVTKRIAIAGLHKLKDKSKVLKDLVWNDISHD